MERDNENARWWTILYLGRSTGKDEKGSYVWKLRDELAAAALGEEDRGFWWLNAIVREHFGAQEMQRRNRKDR